MISIISQWFKKYFSDPEAILLFFLLFISFGLIISMGDILAPVIASIVIAYLLQWWVAVLSKYGIKHKLSYLLVYAGFLAVFVVALLFILPLIWRQMINLFTDLPSILQNAKALILNFLNQYPAYIGEQQMEVLISGMLQDIQLWGKKVLSISLSSIPGVITWIVYLILVPILVFFFLKDQEKIKQWIVKLLPQDHRLISQIWAEMDVQIGNYIRGKITEIIIVGVSTYAVFLIFNLRYSVLLASLVGLSVVIPYVGAAVVTIPVALVGYFQWGFSSEFTYMFISYLVVQALDGNILVPLLFSEAVNLHPVAIIVAILVFGAFWGFWGVFFAIPLATLLKAVLQAWPRTEGS